mmetsp:Transcript_2272/g.2095  ORF Transcript_2272/g.2095 Transcript_2272/m.2095 type:complete len:585 (-) Transcript_2272:113-1867(-)
MKTSELKACLKELGMSQGGDKGTLECRISKGEESVKLGLKTPDGNPVHQLKLAKLKPYAAKAGISPIGSLDEIMFEYIDFLKKNSNNDNGDKGEGDDSTKAEGGNASNGKKPDAAGLSSRVLQLAEEDDFVGILNLGGVGVTASSSVAVLRKAYLKLSLVLHPDKNQSDPKSTTVFQALVNAYERISQPDLVADGPQARNAKKKAAAISRSNEGCRRTRVRCPRCKNPWSETSVEGNPDYFYNFMMTGIKSFNCATCLLEFGCMTALHDCPFCRHSFEYHPSDFHRKITCGRTNNNNGNSSTCTKEFGFHMFHCSDRITKNLKEEVREMREKRATITEQKQRRAESFRRRRRGKSDANAETAFLLGLTNECPRCGTSLADLDDADEIDHLRNCNDETKITANKRKKDATEDKKNEKKQRQELQEDVTAKAAWDLLGASSDTMWMLTDGALQKECAEQGVDVKGKETHEMIAGLVGSRKSLELTKYAGKKGRTKVTTESLPSSLHTMTEKQLRAVAASHGIEVDRKARKIDIIQLLQSEQEKSNGPLMITSGGDVETTKNEGNEGSNDEYIDSDSGSESDYEPDE